MPLMTRLYGLQLLSRPPDKRAQVTVYVKGFLAQGDSPENFEDWMHSHHLLGLSPRHHWASTAFGYSWASGYASAMTLPLPFATASVAYVMGRTFHRLRQWKLPTPAAVVGALAMDAGIHAARLVYQYNAATHNSQQRASMLAEQLQKLRQQHDYVRVVGHSLGCRHVVEACALLPPKERPNALHLCAPAMTRSDLSPFVHCEAPSLAQEKTVIYYSEKDVTLGLVLRAMWRGEQSVGEIGMPNEKIAPNVHLVNASRSLGGYYVGAHTDYADKFHYFAYPSSPSANKQV